MAIKQFLDGSSLDGLTLTETNGTVTTNGSQIIVANTVGDAVNSCGFVADTSQTIAVGDELIMKFKSNSISEYMWVGLSEDGNFTWNNLQTFVYAYDNGFQIWRDGSQTAGNIEITVTADQYKWFRWVFCKVGVGWFHKDAEEDPWEYYTSSWSTNTFIGEQLYFTAQTYSNGGVLTIDSVEHNTDALKTDNPGEIVIDSDSFDNLDDWTVVEGDESISASGGGMVATGGSNAAWDESAAVRTVAFTITKTADQYDEIFFTLECSGDATFVCGISETNPVDITKITGIKSTLSEAQYFDYTEQSGALNITDMDGTAVQFRMLAHEAGCLLYWKNGSTWEPLWSSFYAGFAPESQWSFPKDLYFHFNCNEIDGANTGKLSGFRVVTPTEGIGDTGSSSALITRNRRKRNE